MPRRPVKGHPPRADGARGISPHTLCGMRGWPRVARPSLRGRGGLGWVLVLGPRPRDLLWPLRVAHLRRGPYPCAAPLRAAAPAGSALGPSPRLFRSASCAPLARLRGRSLRPRARGPALRGLRAPSRGSGRPCPSPFVSPAPSVPRRDPPGPPAVAASGPPGSGPGGYGGQGPPIFAPAPGAFLSSGRSAALRGAPLRSGAAEPSAC